MHAPGSSCSQKVRIFLNLKDIPWESHVVDLRTAANYEPWYLGINPRGLVPCLIHDGDVHIESNDIIEHLEKAFPEPPLIPVEMRGRVSQLLQMEDDLHRSLRVLTFRYVIPTRPGAMKSEDALERLRRDDGTIGSQVDPKKHEEIAFWEAANRDGITDEQVSESINQFRSAFETLDETLGGATHILGDQLSVVDIAWYVYASRLISAGYPLHRWHTNVGTWYDRLNARPEFSAEVALPSVLREASTAMQRSQHEQGRSLEAIARQ